MNLIITCHCQIKSFRNHTNFFKLKWSVRWVHNCIFGSLPSYACERISPYPKCELRFPSDLHQMRFYAMLPSCLFGIVMMQLRVEKRRHFALKAHSSSEHSSNSGGCFLTQIFWLDNFNRHIWNCCFIIFLHLTRLLALVINIEMWKMYECNYPNSPPYMLISLPLFGR